MKEYIYNRYNGTITTYKKIRDKEYLCIETGLTICFDLQLLLGKTSENIIDLIEVGDYVNGDLVVDKYYIGRLDVLETTGEDTNAKCLPNDEIRSVITKEKFKSVEYKVGG